LPVEGELAARFRLLYSSSAERALGSEVRIMRKSILLAAAVAVLTALSSAGAGGRGVELLQAPVQYLPHPLCGAEMLESLPIPIPVLHLSKPVSGRPALSKAG
jgi:hypothetical protein